MPIATATRKKRPDTFDSAPRAMESCHSRRAHRFMYRLQLSQMLFDRFLERSRQHPRTVLRSLAVPNRAFISGKVNVLNPQLHAFHQAQPCPIH